MPSINHAHCFFFCGRLAWILLHGEHQSPFWHMTYTQLLVKHRPQHKLTCQIPKKTRGAVSSLRIAFQHLICNATKRTAGDMGAGAVPGRRAPSQQVQIAKREVFGKVTHRQTKQEKCYCKTSGVGVRHATQPGPLYWPLTFSAEHWPNTDHQPTTMSYSAYAMTRKCGWACETCRTDSQQLSADCLTNFPFDLDLLLWDTALVNLLL